MEKTAENYSPKFGTFKVFGDEFGKPDKGQTITCYKQKEDEVIISYLKENGAMCQVIKKPSDFKKTIEEYIEEFNKQLNSKY